MTDALLVMDILAHSCPRGLHKYAFSPVSLITQVLCKVREGEQVLLVAPHWFTQTCFSESKT